jgi:hypothetical protein
MRSRTLGGQGLATSALGLGCMGMTFAYGRVAEAVATDRQTRLLLGSGTHSGLILRRREAAPPVEPYEKDCDQGDGGAS